MVGPSPLTFQQEQPRHSGLCGLARELLQGALTWKQDKLALLDWDLGREKREALGDAPRQLGEVGEMSRQLGKSAPLRVSWESCPLVEDWICSHIYALPGHWFLLVHLSADP